ncbi:hypothetical protein TWF225_006198 [Orbilia oligospora]|nr:hypothetical protein TWF225_006198 [Orbilia oligospora]KAF3250929.1 hypothetical protein TWF128_007360 [Orbilia oligospora]KAF3259141.1 hypothetical protein TWF217_005281 [Orbilia oligospora]
MSPPADQNPISFRLYSSHNYIVTSSTYILNMNWVTTINLFILCLLNVINAVLAGVGPWPFDPNTASDCYSWLQARDGEDCISLAARAPIAVSKLVIWNPSLLEDCDNVIPGNGYCIGSGVTAIPTSSSSSRTTTTSSRVTTTTTTTTTTFTGWPTPSSGTAPNCITFAYFRAADTCETFVARYASTGLTQANLILWNTLLKGDCSGLSDIRGHNICIAIDPTITPTTTTTTSSWPTPSSGTAPNCITFAYFRAADTCDTFLDRYSSTGLTKAKLILWNTLLQSDCSGLSDIRGHNICIAIDPTMTLTTTSRTSSTSASTLSTRTTSASPTIVTPLPTQPGMIAGCTFFYLIEFGEFCDAVVQNLIEDFPDLTVAKLIYWNPAVGPDCDGIYRGTYICVQGPAPPISSTTTTTRSSSTTTTSSRTTTTSSTSATSTTAFTYPTPSSGTAPNCIKLAYFRSTDTCDTFIARYGPSDGLTKANLILWNTLLLPDCSGLSDIRLHNVCIAVSATPITTSSRTTTTSSRTTTTTSRTTTTTTATFTRNPTSFPSASTPLCVPTTTTPAPPKVTGGTTLNTAITTACQQLLGPSGSFYMEVGNPYKTTVLVGGYLTQFLIQIKLGGFAVTQSLCVTQFQSINTKCTSGSPALTPGGCFYTSDANMQCCIFTS